MQERTEKKLEDYNDVFAENTELRRQFCDTARYYKEAGITISSSSMEDFVKDYEITVFDIAFLPDETINKFKSTFKHVAHFFKYRES